jgi:hypothetical protein
MRAVDDSQPRFAAVLRELLIWKQLPESDLSRMVPHFFLITDDFREMEDQGLLTMAFAGDEYVLRPTTYGRLWLEQYDAGRSGQPGQSGAGNQAVGNGNDGERTEQ